MSILDVVNATSRGVTEKTKNMQELANLKRKITYEQERIVEIFTDIGKKYYEKDESNTDFSDLKVLCEDIDVRRRRIKKMLFELNNMRGYKICPQCSAQVSGKYKFCGTCGAKIPDPEDDDFMETPEMIDGIEDPTPAV
ncbi:MAG: zinc ribbon domain-containing protein [Oscillospiraceae bacterium]|nr:zinc ribbon domain-containing protein [Oscillospiraceae bacterium]